MPTVVACPTCAARASVPDKLIGTGRPLLCPRCGGNLFKPAAAEESPAIEAPPVRRGAYAAHEQVYDRDRQSTVVQTNVVVQQSGQFPHLLHLFLTILTCGFWLPAWVIHYIVSGR